MKKLVILFLGVLLIGIGTSQAQETWSLQKCFDYAIENNISIKQQALNQEYSKNQLKQARDNRLPTLNAEIDNNNSFGRSLTYDNTYKNVNSTSLSGTLSTSLTLFKGKTLSNTIKQRELDLEASMNDLEKAKNDIRLSIVAEYLEILFKKEIMQVTESNINVTQKQITRTTQLVNAGSEAKGTLLEIEAQLAREELELVNNQNALQLAYLNLYQFLDLPMSENFKIEKPKLPEIKAELTMLNAAEVFNNAINIRPEIKAAQIRVQSAIKELDVSKGARYPTLSFSGYYYNLYNNQYTDNSGDKISFGDQLKNNRRSNLGLTLSIPIFNKFQVKNNISNAELQISDYKYKLKTVRNTLRKEIEQVYTNASAAYKRYLSTQKAVESMKEAFRYTKEKYNVGIVNSLEYNQSKNNLTEAQSNLLQAKYEYIFRTKILDFYNGVPITL